MLGDLAGVSAKLFILAWGDKIYIVICGKTETNAPYSEWPGGRWNNNKGINKIDLVSRNYELLSIVYNKDAA